MQVDLFDFDLPQDRIALRPANPKEAARLLVVRGDALDDRHISDLTSLLDRGDVLVVNDTKVLNAQLRGFRGPRSTSGAGANIDVTLHKQVDDRTWLAFVRPAKRLKNGDHLDFEDQLNAKVVACNPGGEVELCFSLSGDTFADAIAKFGATPLPPYIASQRSVDERDKQDYQTVFAEFTGSVAAPTAGLHFCETQLDELRNRGVEIEQVTLHVGAGTFLPVKTEDTDQHKMHSEWGEINAATASRLTSAKKEGRRIICVGTTSLRLLEAAATSEGVVTPFSGETDIFITPGYKFKIVDKLLTNFHLPRSTLFMLVCAFSGRERMHGAYAHAVKSNYRFYSYGDACLLSPEELG